MTDAEFREWLAEEVAAERMTVSQRTDLLRQKEAFDARFGAEDSPLRLEYRFRIAGYVNGQMRWAEEIHRLIDGAREEFPGRMVYFEPIGFALN